MNVKTPAKVLTYLSAALCLTAAYMGIWAFIIGDYGDALLNGFLFFIGAICFYINKEMAMDPAERGSDPFKPEL
jgi:hypothetical protein